MVKWSWWYLGCQQIVAASLRLYYKKITFQKYPKHLEKEGVIFACVHQQSFMDPILIGALTLRQHIYLTRSDAFKNPIARRLFTSFKMLPIYRNQDGVNSVDKNKEIFARCRNALFHKHSLIIFPEANCHAIYHVRRLKTGAARIALTTEAEHDYTANIHIIPVGIQYQHHYKFNQQVQLNFGEPIKMKDFLTLHKENSRKAYLKLSEELGEKIKDNTLHIADLEYYDMLLQMKKTYRHSMLKNLGLSKRPYKNVYQAEKTTVDLLNEYVANSSAETRDAWKEKITKYTKQLTELNLRDYLFEKDKQPTFLATIGLLLLAPIHLYGVVNNYLPYKIPERIVDQKIKNDTFFAPLKMVIAMLLFPIFYLVQTLLVWGISGNGWTALAYVASLPIAGYFAINYWKKSRKIAAKYRYNKAWKEQPTIMESLKTTRQSVLDLVDNLYETKNQPTKKAKTLAN